MIIRAEINEDILRSVAQDYTTPKRDLVWLAVRLITESGLVAKAVLESEDGVLVSDTDDWFDLPED